MKSIRIELTEEEYKLVPEPRTRWVREVVKEKLKDIPRDEFGERMDWYHVVIEGKEYTVLAVSVADAFVRLGKEDKMPERWWIGSGPEPDKATEEVKAPKKKWNVQEILMASDDEPPFKATKGEDQDIETFG